MIDHLTLHIGHQKTGTSSVQATFRENTGRLAAAGLHYDSGVRNHQAIGRSFHERTADRRNLAVRAAALARMRASGLPRALVSTETFVRLGDEEVERCIATFAAVARDIDVIIYVRHPVAFASSAAVQGLRSGRPLARSIAAPRVLPLREIITRWRHAVGRERLHVRPFARELLTNGDVVDDLLAVVGLGDLAAEVQKVQVNEGLSVLAAHLLDWAQRMNDGPPLPLDSLRAYDAIAGPKYVLPRRALQTVRAMAEPELRFLQEEYAIELPEPTDKPTPPPRLDEEALESLARVVFLATRYAHDLDRSTVGRLLDLRSPFTRRWDIERHWLSAPLQRLGLLRLLGVKRPRRSQTSWGGGGDDQAD